MDNFRKAKGKFADFRKRWQGKGIQVEFTFEQWYEWWLSHGIDKNQKQPRVHRDTLVIMQRTPSKTLGLDNCQVATYGGNDRGLPSAHDGVARPHTWKYKDPLVHAKHEPYLRAKAQWNFRGEENDLTFSEWCEFWTDDLWPQRGRGIEKLTLTRKDPEGSWTKSNCEIVDRREQLYRASQLRKRKYGTR